MKVKEIEKNLRNLPDFEPDRDFREGLATKLKDSSEYSGSKFGNHPLITGFNLSLFFLIFLVITLLIVRVDIKEDLRNKIAGKADIYYLEEKQVKIDLEKIKKYKKSNSVELFVYDLNNDEHKLVEVESEIKSNTLVIDLPPGYYQIFLVQGTRTIHAQELSL